MLQCKQEQILIELYSHMLIYSYTKSDILQNEIPIFYPIQKLIVEESKVLNFKQKAESIIQNIEENIK